jgi:uncharacterized protein (UPF0332 family)
VSETAAAPLDRGRQELLAARALLDGGFPSQALTRAYFAAFHAASAALLAVGETPSTPSGVLAAFNRRVVQDDHLELDHARALRKLFEDRNDIDYALAQAPDREAEVAIDQAQALIDAVGARLAPGR